MRKVLIIIPFNDIYPPMNGGMLRCINMLDQLAKYFEVTVIIHQDLNSFLKAIESYPSIANCKVISTNNNKKTLGIFSFLPSRIGNALKYRYWNRSLNGPASGNFLLVYPVLIDLLKKTTFDYVILEEISLLHIANVIRRYQPNTPVIYDAHNVNSRLAKISLSNGLITQRHYELSEKVESNLAKIVNAIFVCSELDLHQLMKMNNGNLNAIVIPNGVTVEDRTITKNNSDEILFCGSLDYYPNQEGLIWFCEKIFPLILIQRPSVRLMVVGKGYPGNQLNELLKHKSIIYYGTVEKVNIYYQRATVAIAPLLSGSGTRLKILEAMGLKVAVVSTAMGAEGINYTNGTNIVIANDKEIFANAVIELLNDKNKAVRIANEAFLFVKKEYDWNVIGQKISNYLT
jgi:glycosyltransferase involved in cell wall biosynthesis